MKDNSSKIKGIKTLPHIHMYYLYSKEYPHPKKTNDPKPSTSENAKESINIPRKIFL